MPLSRKLSSLWRNLTRRREVEADLREEIHAYRDLLEDEKLRSGSDAASAHRVANLELGTPEGLKEQVRDARTGAFFDAIGAEFRQSLRGLRRNPSLTILGTAMLALGMGASIVVFSIFQSALLKPLPFRESHRVVSIAETRLDRGIDEASFSEANFWDVRSLNHSFEEVGAYHYNESNLTGALAVLIGSEGSGLPRGLLAKVDDTVAIPHTPQVESLNAGVAGSIILYEAARQRK